MRLGRLFRPRPLRAIVVRALLATELVQPDRSQALTFGVADRPLRIPGPLTVGALLAGAAVDGADPLLILEGCDLLGDLILGERVELAEGPVQPVGYSSVSLELGEAVVAFGAANEPRLAPNAA